MVDLINPPAKRSDRARGETASADLQIVGFPGGFEWRSVTVASDGRRHAVPACGRILSIDCPFELRQRAALERVASQGDGDRGDHHEAGDALVAERTNWVPVQGAGISRTDTGISRTDTGISRGTNLRISRRNICQNRRIETGTC